MATSPAAEVHLTGTPGSTPANDMDDFVSLPDDDKDLSLLIESSKTGDPSSALRTDDPDAPRKKKKTRRGKKKQRHAPTQGVSIDADENDKGGATDARPDEAAADAAATRDDDAEQAVPCKKQRLNRRQRRRRSGRLPAPILRPTEVPRAPLNSTSFIIDDHENSLFYIDFDAAARRSPSGPDGWQLESSTADDEDMEEAALAEAEEFSRKDFENVYRRAREEELAELDRPELVECVRGLEARVRELEAQLTLYDPEVWVTKLQNQLLHLQEENLMLVKTREALLKKHGIDP